MIPLIKLSDAVSELSVAKKDNDRVNYLYYLILAKSVLRDLKFNYLNQFKRIYIQVDKTTMVARLPFDYYKFVTLSVIDKCIDRFGHTEEKVLPLAHNQYINITPFKTPDETCKKSCGCVPSNPVCQELDTYSVIEETVTLPNDTTGTKTTTLITCPNGDITKEVCEPYLTYINGNWQCDYAVNMEVILDTVCSYSFSFVSLDPPLPIVITMTLNGDIITSPSLGSVPDVNAWFQSYGWTKLVSESYIINSTTDVWGTDVVIVDGHAVTNNLTLDRTCSEGNILQFPYTIVSYEVDGEVVTVNEEISNQDDQDFFFYYLGFTKVDDENYTLEDSETVYSNIEVEIGGSPELSPPITSTISITQSGCNRHLISDGFQTKCVSDVLCNVTLKNCGCIEETADNIKTIVSCCAPFLDSCQIGLLNNWSGWNWGSITRPTNTQAPYTIKGTYRLDEPNYLIYLDSVNADTLLLSYYNDGNCDGEFLIPEMAMECLKAGIAFRAAQYDDNASDGHIQALKMNYSAEKTDFSKWLNPLKENELVQALYAKHKY